MAFASYSTSDLGSPAGDVVKRLPMTSASCPILAQAANVPAHESRTRHEDTSSAWKRCILALDLDGEESVALDLGDLNRLGARRDRQAAACQSRGRRQQVMPEPQPSSFGSIRLGMPLRSTNRMPVRHAR